MLPLLLRLLVAVRGAVARAGLGVGCAALVARRVSLLGADSGAGGRLARMLGRWWRWV